MMSWFGVLLVVGLFVTALLCMEIGARAFRPKAGVDEEEGGGFGMVTGSVFAILSLLLAFTFSSAASRLEKRRDLIVQEANAIGTAYLRIDLLPTAEQPKMRELFREYGDTRIGYYQNVGDEARMAEGDARMAELQREIWRTAVAASAGKPQTQYLVLPALNEMIDVTTTRAVARRVHIPKLVVGFLVSITLLAALLTGRALRKSTKMFDVHRVTLAAVMSITLYVIVDYEFPRIGTIRLDGADEAIASARKAMDEDAR